MRERSRAEDWVYQVVLEIAGLQSKDQLPGSEKLAEGLKSFWSVGYRWGQSDAHEEIDEQMERLQTGQRER